MRNSYIFVIVLLSTLILGASAVTDYLDVLALKDLYTQLNLAPQLKGWKLSDDTSPCDEPWLGVSCSGSSVIFVKIQGLELTGFLGYQLSNFHNLKELDVSSNKIHGIIPYGLPMNATRLNLAFNNFSGEIPSTMSSLSKLRHLNLSHNSLAGPIGDVFHGLQNLKEMDLSFNNFSGDLPTSFSSLTNVTKLYLQDNKFTGSVILLAGLPLTDLNIQSNHFSGVLPYQFRYIQNLWLEGNILKAGANDPAWDFPMSNVTQNITSPPTTQSTAIEGHPTHPSEKSKTDTHKKKKLGSGGVASLVGGITLVVTCAAIVAMIAVHRSRGKKRFNMEISSECSEHSLPLSVIRDYSSGAQESPQVSSIASPPSAIPRRALRTRTRADNSSRRSFCKKRKVPISAKVYTVSELQSATNGFSEENLLGEGSLGSVFKAVFPNGQVSAVKNVHTVSLSLFEEEQFLEVIWNASRLRHPNIVSLLGYCLENGQHLLVYEYVRNLTLDDALHADGYVSLSWGLRLRIALGVARALEYLHSTCVPPIVHNNLKAANILLDEELMPRISDCGLSVLRPLTSNSIKVKASEMAIGDTGYVAPEQGQLGSDGTKGDVYSFGILLLELLTGKRPFDRSRLRQERSLVSWATSRLHDNESLERMVDPNLKKTFPTRALSKFADIVSLCVQESEFRPPMAEIVESLTLLIHKSWTGTGSHGITEADPFDKSFRSSHTGFMGSLSDTMSYSSV